MLGGVCVCVCGEEEGEREEVGTLQGAACHSPVMLIDMSIVTEREVEG